MFGVHFEMVSGMTHYPDMDFESQTQAMEYAKKSLEVSPDYSVAIIKDQLFPILRLSQKDLEGGVIR